MDDRSKASKLADHLFDAPTDALGRSNRACSYIAVVMLIGLLAIYLETLR